MLAQRMIPQFPVVAEFDRLFESFLSSGHAPTPSPVFPRMNIWENDDGFTVDAEVPGFAIENIDITLEDGELTIAGQRACESTQESSACRCRERFSGRFSRTIRLSTEIDADRVEATLINGILSVQLPKQEGARARKIQVRPA